jgi:hypothetical protein
LAGPAVVDGSRTASIMRTVSELESAHAAALREEMAATIYST